MTGKIRITLIIGIVLYLIPVIVRGQDFNSMPSSTYNHRFFTDVIRDSLPSLAWKHPGLTINGFDNGGDNSHGYGLKQILQIVYNQGQDPLPRSQRLVGDARPRSSASYKLNP